MNQFMLAPDQLFSFLAATIAASDPNISAEDAVKKAINIVAWAGIHTNNGTLQKRVNEIDPQFLEEQAAKQRLAQGGLMVPNGPMNPDLLRRNRRES